MPMIAARISGNTNRPMNTPTQKLHPSDVDGDRARPYAPAAMNTA